MPNAAPKALGPAAHAVNARMAIRQKQTGMALRTLPLRRDDDLTVNLALRVQRQTELTSAKDALENQEGKASNVRERVWRALKLVSAGLEVELHLLALFCLPPFGPARFLGSTDMCACGGGQLASLACSD